MKSFGLLRRLADATAFRWLVGAIVLVLAVAHAGISIPANLLSTVEPDYLIGALTLNALSLILVSLRSLLVLRSLGHRVQPGVLLSSVTLGFVVGGLTPAASGEVFRAEALRSKAGVPIGDGLTLIAFERGLSAYLLFISGASAGALLLLPWPASGLVLAIAGGLIVVPSFAGRLLRFAPIQEGANDRWSVRALLHLARLAANVERLLSNRTLLVTWSVITLTVFAVVALQFWLLARGLGGTTQFEAAWLGFSLSQLAGIASLLPFGIGISDGSLAATLVRFGLTTDQAIAVALLVRFAVTVPLIAAALVSYAYLTMKGSADTTDLVGHNEPLLTGDQ